MRLWSLDPELLDAKGMVALWREGLLALKVLKGETKGYRFHPQLERFKSQADPVASMRAYLAAVCDEADRRGYRFDRAKIEPVTRAEVIPVTEGQLAYEWAHLLSKLQQRDPERALLFRRERRQAVTHPLFRVIPGEIASWERPSELPSD